MKHSKKIKLALTAKIQVYDGFVSVQFRLPKRWLRVLATVLGALIASTPLARLIDVILRLLH